MNNPLPPLNSLRAFKVIGESGGIRVASDILNISQSAVSRHLAILEEYLQVRLFRREGRGLSLTDAGKDYLLQITAALDAISSATTATREQGHRQTIVLSAPPSLTANWLLPRLIEFREEFPEFNLTLLDSMTLDPKNTEVDCAIEYRFQPATGYQSDILLTDDLVPLLSPEFFNVADFTELEDLRGTTLIETSRRLLSWRGLLHDRRWITRQPFLTVSYSVQALEAARLGYGIALTNWHNARQIIDTGQLCVPFRFADDFAPRAPSYYVTLPLTQNNPERSEIIRSWLLKHATVQ